MPSSSAVITIKQTDNYFSYFNKKSGEDRYCIFAVLGGHSPKKDDMAEGNYEMWNTWDLDLALYSCIYDDYKANLGEDGVVFFKHDAGVLSDNGEDNELFLR